MERDRAVLRAESMICNRSEALVPGRFAPQVVAGIFDLPYAYLNRQSVKAGVWLCADGQITSSFPSDFALYFVHIASAQKILPTYV